MPEKIQFEAGIIEGYATILYARAASIVRWLTVVGALLGVAGGAAGLGGISGTSAGALVGGGVVGLLGAFIGYALGSARAFTLRLAAQTALCQVAIERNTRRA